MYMHVYMHVYYVYVCEYLYIQYIGHTNVMEPVGASNLHLVL